MHWHSPHISTTLYGIIITNTTSVFRRLEKFKKVHSSVSANTVTVLKRHTWYLTEDLISVSLFDESAPLAERTVHARMIHDAATTDELEIRKPALPAIATTSAISDYIGPRSRLPFDLAGVSLDFLLADNWTETAEYAAVKSTLANLSPLNDSAERALHLATTYNTRFTKDEAGYQELLQVVEQHRKDYSLKTKADLKKFY